MLENEKGDQISSVGQKWQDPFFDRRLWYSWHVTEPAAESNCRSWQLVAENSRFYLRLFQF